MPEKFKEPIPLDFLAGAAAFALSFVLLDRLASSAIGNSMAAMMGGQKPADDWAPMAVNLAVSLLAAATVFFAVRQVQQPSQGIAVPKNSSGRHLRAKALDIIQRGLSPDAKAALKEVKRSGSLTQDSLRLRLGWSKAKTSTILTNLDKLNLIQRERMGKTYRVFLSRTFKP